MDSRPALSVLSVNVALPRLLGQEAGEPLLSAIGKKPVCTSTIAVGPINLAGDAQANLEKHGGPDKAVYAYPADHWPWWEKEHSIACAPGAFGENLTLTGADETRIHIGDRFAWGEAVLEVAQPRVPCIKLQMHSGRAEIGSLMTMSGRCGWYFRVLEAGIAPVDGGVLIPVEPSAGPTVREAYSAAFGRGFPATRRLEIAGHTRLSEAWRKRLLAVHA